MGTESADQAESYVFRNADGEVSIPKAHVDLNDPSVIDPFGLGGAAAGVAAAAKQATATAETAKESIGELQSTVVKTATAAQGAIDNAQKALAEGQAYAKDADMAVKVGLGLALGIVAVKLFTGYLEKRAERK